MTDKKITDRDYLFLSAVLKARETDMIDSDRMERMLSAADYGEAAKLIVDNGYPDLSGADAAGIDEALNGRRNDIFYELSRFSPQSEIVDVFRMKYDYHNAKVLIKAEGAGVSGDRLLSFAGRVKPEKLAEAYSEDDYRFVPQKLGAAMREAKAVLARTSNPQTADFILDRAYFGEMKDLADEIGSDFISKYVAVLTDSANLRSAVRTVRMGKDMEFMLTALVPGGTVGPERLAQAVMGGDGVASVFGASVFRDAAALGAEAIKGGSMTKFELACDNAVTAFLSSAKLICFGQEPLVEYLALTEAEITAVRMILTGRLAGMNPDSIRERLREINA